MTIERLLPARRCIDERTRKGRKEGRGREKEKEKGGIPVSTALSSDVFAPPNFSLKKEEKRRKGEGGGEQHRPVGIQTVYLFCNNSNVTEISGEKKGRRKKGEGKGERTQRRLPLSSSRKGGSPMRGEKKKHKKNHRGERKEGVFTQLLLYFSAGHFRMINRRNVRREEEKGKEGGKKKRKKGILISYFYKRAVLAEKRKRKRAGQAPPPPRLAVPPPFRVPPSLLLHPPPKKTKKNPKTHATPKKKEFFLHQIHQRWLKTHGRVIPARTRKGERGEGKGRWSSGCRT